MEVFRMKELTKKELGKPVAIEQLPFVSYDHPISRGVCHGCYGETENYSVSRCDKCTGK